MENSTNDFVDGLKNSIRSGSIFEMPEITLTKKETQLMKAFGRSDYAEFDECHWMWEIKNISRLTGKTFSGVCSSLTEKGLIGSNTEGDPGMIGVKVADTYTIWLTEKGKQVYKTL